MRLQVTALHVFCRRVAALERALEQAGIALEAKPERPITAVGADRCAEAVDVPVATPERYARSPRSTPGATRA